ncbi:hypothetical protein ACQP1K_00730 [Sphaerimonospora sp. CA-214678]|uniref:hypothetical protein n=1 Tax=Sphaerimonospora sp. CA-214678 TaxID=3240029 RepID=UPI003D8BDCD7
MALQGPIPISFALLFPHGCYVVGEVQAAKDFDAKGTPKPRTRSPGCRSGRYR